MVLTPRVAHVHSNAQLYYKSFLYPLGCGDGNGVEMSAESRTPTAREWVAGGVRFTNSAGHRIFYRRAGSGPTLVLLHGFPTWSFDYAEVATDLAADHDVIAVDFLGFGASDKPRRHRYTVAGSADLVEELLGHLGIDQATLVVHDYGAIVGQELLDRRRASRLTFDAAGVHLLNCGIVYSAYRPTRAQKILANPVLGPVVSRGLDKAKWSGLLNSVRGDRKLTDAEFDQVWYGIALEDGHKLAHRHIRYNAERDVHHRRWQSALEIYDGPLHLIWGLDDPVSGEAVLREAMAVLPAAIVTELPGVGHFPQVEVPAEVSRAIRGVRR